MTFTDDFEQELRNFTPTRLIIQYRYVIAFFAPVIILMFLLGVWTVTAGNSNGIGGL